jgi:hypothetical protein
VVTSIEHYLLKGKSKISRNKIANIKSGKRKFIETNSIEGTKYRYEYSA